MKEKQAADIHIDRKYPSPIAGVLSYLVPGLGQIYQRRFAKGILFLVCLYGLFFFGMYLGDWQNVYVYAPDPADNQNQPAPAPGSIFGSLGDRVRFIAQAWIGIVAWPAVIQYYSENPNGDSHPWFGKFQRRPSSAMMNQQLRDNDKSPDLGWVYTVIAGVLNILVIYDAYAGPVFQPRSRRDQAKDESSESEEVK